MALTIGSQAPDFTLFSSDKTPYTLSDQKGSEVVVLFFPLAFTGVCTAELCSLRDDIAYYSGLNAKVVAISVDSVFCLDKFKEEQKLPFPLLSDFNKDASSAYDCLYENFAMGMKGVSKRAAFVVDAEGKIKYAEVLEDAGQVPNFDKIKAVLA